MTNQDISTKIQNKEIDINNQSSFFGSIIKGFIYNLNTLVKIRDQKVPHYIINTGDETMALELKGYDHSKDPLEQTNEDYIYTCIPRAVVTPHGIAIQTDQMTSPYTKGSFQYEEQDTIGTFVGEFRRIPFKMTFDVDYLVDNYTDYLELLQQIVTKMIFIRTFEINYMGQTIMCSYVVPDSEEGETNIDFDLGTTDDRRIKLSLSIELESNIPVYTETTCVPSDAYISNPIRGIKVYQKGNLEKALKENEVD
jgi:hypothetical protein